MVLHIKHSVEETIQAQHRIDMSAVCYPALFAEQHPALFTEQHPALFTEQHQALFTEQHPALFTEQQEALFTEQHQALNTKLSSQNNTKLSSHNNITVDISGEEEQRGTDKDVEADHWEKDVDQVDFRDGPQYSSRQNWMEVTCCHLTCQLAKGGLND